MMENSGVVAAGIPVVKTYISVQLWWKTAKEKSQNKNLVSANFKKKQPKKKVKKNYFSIKVKKELFFDQG